MLVRCSRNPHMLSSDRISTHNSVSLFEMSKIRHCQDTSLSFVVVFVVYCRNEEAAGVIDNNILSFQSTLRSFNIDVTCS